MKPISQYITAMLATLFGVALISCRSHSDEPTDTSKMSISFRVETRNGGEPAGSEGSSSTPEGYEDANAWENYINITGGDYLIAFFDDSNRCITPFSPTKISEVAGTNYEEYILEGKVPAMLTMYSNFKIVVLANWGTDNYPEIKTGTRLEDVCCPTGDSNKGQFQAFSGGGFIAGAATRYIPMYGVKKYTGVKFGVDNENNPTALYGNGNFGPVNLLRAVAKVELIFDTDDPIELDPDQEIYITRHNAYGYCAPEGVTKEDEYFHNYTWDTDFWNGHLHLVGGKNDEGENSLIMTPLEVKGDGESGSGDDSDETTRANENLKKRVWVAYLPEYRNLAMETGEKDCNNSDFDASSEITITPARIAVPHIQGGSSRTSHIEFAKYSDGEPGKAINIERNNIYRFTITNVDQRIKWKVEALPWNKLLHEEIVM